MPIFRGGVIERGLDHPSVTCYPYHITMWYGVMASHDEKKQVAQYVRDAARNLNHAISIAHDNGLVVDVDARHDFTTAGKKSWIVVKIMEEL